MNIIDAGAAKLAGLQIDQLAKLRSGQITLDHLERFNNLTPEEREERFGDWKRPTSISPTKIYLKRLIEGEWFAIHAIEDAKTFKESGVFRGGVYGENLLGVAKPTSAIKVIFEELVEDGKFPEFLGNTAALLERRRLYRGHIIKLCQKYAYKLQRHGYPTLAVVTKDNEPVNADLSNVFVARMLINLYSKLKVYVDLFSRDRVWFYNRLSVVSLQQ